MLLAVLVVADPSALQCSSLPFPAMRLQRTCSCVWRCGSCASCYACRLCSCRSANTPFWQNTPQTAGGAPVDNTIPQTTGGAPVDYDITPDDSISVYNTALPVVARDVPRKPQTVAERFGIILTTFVDLTGPGFGTVAGGIVGNMDWAFVSCCNFCREKSAPLPSSVLNSVQKGWALFISFVSKGWARFISFVWSILKVAFLFVMVVGCLYLFSSRRELFIAGSEALKKFDIVLF